MKNAKKGASEELYYDIALLSGARIQQIQKMKDEDDDEETQALIRKQEKTLLKVLKYKLKECWPYHMDHIKWFDPYHMGHITRKNFSKEFEKSEMVIMKKANLHQG